jgi:hypothetical protein
MPSQHDKEGRVKCQIQVFPPPEITLSLKIFDDKKSLMPDGNVQGVSACRYQISGGRR